MITIVFYVYQKLHHFQFFCLPCIFFTGITGSLQREQHTASIMKENILKGINSECSLLSSRTAIFKPSVLSTTKLQDLGSTDFIKNVLAEMKDRYKPQSRK